MEQTHKPMDGLFLRINLQNAKESQSQVHNGIIGIFLTRGAQHHLGLTIWWDYDYALEVSE